MILHITQPRGQTKVKRVMSLTGRQMMMIRRSVVARLARKVLVGEQLNDLLLTTVRMMRMLPMIPRMKINLK